MKLAEYGQAVAYEVAFWMQGLANPSYPAAQLGGLSQDLTRKLRALAILGLVAAADGDCFHHNLIRSGRVRRLYLRRMRLAGQTQDHHFGSGHYEPLLDALAAGDWELARQIVEASPTEYREGHEYEDDYCYARMVSCWSLEPPLEQEVPEYLSRFAAYVEGQPNPRLALCRALQGGEQAAFDEALAGFLDARDLEIEAAQTRGQLEEPHVVALRRVSVEALALLRLAERRGLRTESEYRYCPSLARAPMQTPLPEE